MNNSYRNINQLPPESEDYLVRGAKL